jgi:hypothetical protein
VPREVAFSQEAQDAIARARRIAAAEHCEKATPQHLAIALSTVGDDSSQLPDRKALLQADLVRVLARSGVLAAADPQQLTRRRHLLQAIREIAAPSDLPAGLPGADEHEWTDHPAQRPLLRARTYKAEARARTRIE